MSNVALREARNRAHLSQHELARRIREAGFSTGDANGCTVRMVQRWESGETRRPRPHYLLALENVLGQPIENLGFDADLRHGMDRARALADASLDSVLPLPEPAESYGPLTGIWLSTYEYRSSGRDATFTSRHYVMLLQRGARLLVRSLPAAGSQPSLGLGGDGQVSGGTGRGATWAGAAPRAFRLPGLSAVRGAGASSYAPHGGERVTPQSKRTHPPIYLHRCRRIATKRC